MDLREHCSSLKKDDLFKLALRLCEKALPIWGNYASGETLRYVDTVVGMSHQVRVDLLYDSILFCQKKQFKKLFGRYRLNKLLNEYLDPVISLQDLDWELPYPVQRVFYAVYNLLDGIQKPISTDNELTHYLSVNQAVEGLEKSHILNFDEIYEIIYGIK